MIVRGVKGISSAAFSNVIRNITARTGITGRALQREDLDIQMYSIDMTDALIAEVKLDPLASIFCILIKTVSLMFYRSRQ